MHFWIISSNILSSLKVFAFFQRLASTCHLAPTYQQVFQYHFLISKLCKHHRCIDSTTPFHLFYLNIKKHFPLALTVFALTASAQVNAYLADKSFGKLGLDFPDRIGSISGRVFIDFTKASKFRCTSFSNSWIYINPALNKLLAISQLLGDGQDGEFLSIL